jgi:S-adenosylmethionine:tRNA ribosyltransferase-isomerase
MRLSDFHYDLPLELIARYPLEKRSASRLLCLDRNTGTLLHHYFSDLSLLISPNDLLVCNNSRVIPARLFGNKETGGRVEILIERILDDHRILAHVRASKTPKPQSILLFAKNYRQLNSSILQRRPAACPRDPENRNLNLDLDQVCFEVLNRNQDLFELKCLSSEPVLSIIESIGEIPLPPYFHRSPDESDKERYQTIYAQHKGSVAAPTAGLHFDAELMNQLKNKGIDIGYVTLHVGAGTFAPVRVEHIEEHRMHAEYITVTEALCEQVNRTKARGGRVIAVGTTSARCLETATRSGKIQPYSGDTDIFIYPGFQFQCIDALITNFHLPCSTLLMLVTAFGGYENVMRAYHEAIKEKYRFYSYGDAMFIQAVDA